MKTAIYLRKSRAEEAAETVEDTLKRHKETLLEFAAKNGLIIADIYEEVVSGESLYARPEMLRLLQQVDGGAYDAILCMDIDRLGRGSMSDQGVILETIKRSGTKIITPRKVYDLENEIDEEYTEFETFLARRELSLIKRRMRRGIERSIQDGAYLANAPYGYKKTRDGKQATLEIYEPEAKFVRLIFDWYANGGIGTETIARRLNDMGAKPHRSAAFAKTSILRIIRDRAYIGEVVWGKRKRIRKPDGSSDYIPQPEEKWIVVDGLHPPIIDKDTFQRAQEVLAGRWHPPAHLGVLYNPLSGIMYCGKCGKKLVRRKYASWGATKKRAINFICPTPGCTPYDRMDVVEHAVLDALKARFDEIKARVEQEDTVQRDTTEAAIRAISKEEKAASAQLDRLHDLLEQGVYTTDVFLQRSRLLQSRLEKMAEQKRELQEQAKKSGSPARLIPAFDRLFSSYWAADASEKNRLLKAVVDRIIYSKRHGAEIGEFSLEIFLR